MHKIVISYRREDSVETAGRIYDWLDSRLVPDSIFIDVDSIPPGLDFRTAIKDTIRSASVMLVIVGPRWLTVREPNGGAPRLDNPNDFVRAEVELAIQNNIPIIPILVQEATMLASDDLPASLMSLAYRQAVKVRPNPDFQGDMIRVMKGIESIDSEIVFSQQAGKANTHVKEEPTDPEPYLPPIPEGGRSEYGFYYTRVVNRRINTEYDNRVIEKEFVLDDGPKIKHVVKAIFEKHWDFVWEPPNFKLIVRIDGTTITEEKFKLTSGQINEKVTTYHPDYSKSITQDGLTYSVEYKINGDYTLLGKRKILNMGDAPESYQYRVTQFEVSVEGYTLLGIRSLWD